MVNDTQEPNQEISQIDGKPIVKMTAADFYHGNILDDIRNKLASEHGTAIVEALNQQDLKASAIPVKKLNNFVQRKENAPEIGSSHIRVQDPDGETEDFVLSVRRYYHNPAQAARKGISRLKSSTTYLAFSPDRFYLQDDENGNELWPVTFPAVSLDDPTDKITVTFNKDGFVSSSLLESSKVKTISSSGQPDLVFAEATPVIEPMDVDPCYPTCGGGGPLPGRTDDDSRGGNTTGPTSGQQDYFSIKSIQLITDGDGDGHSELQMFVQESDDYGGLNMPLKYKYRFDNAYYKDPVRATHSYNTKIYGADKKVYEVPDVNSAGTTYYVDSYRWTDEGYYGWDKSSNKFDYFPLVDLTYNPGPWRLVMSDDDKDYPKFSRRRQSEFHPNIGTGTHGSIETGFTVERKTYGSSDDPRWESGVRKITKSNALLRSDSFGDIDISKSTSSGVFKYKFSLEQY